MNSWLHILKIYLKNEFSILTALKSYFTRSFPHQVEGWRKLVWQHELAFKISPLWIRVVYLYASSWSAFRFGCTKVISPLLSITVISRRWNTKGRISIGPPSISKTRAFVYLYLDSVWNSFVLYTAKMKPKRRLPVNYKLDNPNNLSYWFIRLRDDLAARATSDAKLEKWSRSLFRLKASIYLVCVCSQRPVKRRTAGRRNKKDRDRKLKQVLRFSESIRYRK